MDETTKQTKNGEVPSRAGNVMSQKKKRVEFTKGEIIAIYDGVKSYGEDFESIWLANKDKFQPGRNPAHLNQKWKRDLVSHTKKEYLSQKGTERNRHFQSKKEKRVDFSKEEVLAIYDGVKRFGEDFETIWSELKDQFHPSRNPTKLYDKWRHGLASYSKKQYVNLKFKGGKSRTLAIAKHGASKSQVETGDSSSSESDEESFTESDASSPEPKRAERVPFSKSEVLALYRGVELHGSRSVDFRNIWLAMKRKFHPSRNPTKLYDKWRHDLQHYNKTDYIDKKFNGGHVLALENVQ